MPTGLITTALTAEAAALAQVVSGLTDADLSRPSPCPPWTIAELLGHILVATDRIGPALVTPDEPGARLISTAGYYRPDDRFSPATNADRVEVARALTRNLAPAGAAAIAAEVIGRTAEAVRLIESAPAGRTVRSRHGDPMLLTDFARTRVVELGVHGLDVAAGLDRPPWLTSQAGDILEELLLPAGGGVRLQQVLGCDRTGLIARLTGRVALSAAQSDAISAAGVPRLSLG